MKHNIVFCSVICPSQQSEFDSLLLAESIRAFGGALAGQPIWFFQPDFGKPLANAARQRLQRLNVSVIPFKIAIQELRFFFMGQLAGLAQAEGLCAGETDILAWMDANTILLNEPNEFLLSVGKSLGYCPVHHLLLGSRFDRPLDPFWSQIYQGCQVPPEKVFPMKPVVEDIQMRPYFNAGILITRPEKGLLRKWHRTFLDIYQAPAFQAFYQQDQRYAIFMHQAVLAGVVLRECEQQEMLELPETYNYPVHLFEQDATMRRPSSMDELVTFRHEGFYLDADWAKEFPASERLKKWLAGQMPVM